MRNRPHLVLLLATLFFCAFTLPGYTQGLAGAVQSTHYSLRTHADQISKTGNYKDLLYSKEALEAVQKASPEPGSQQAIPSTLGIGGATDVPGTSIDYQGESQRQEDTPQSDSQLHQSHWFEHYPPLNDNAFGPRGPVYREYPEVRNQYQYQNKGQQLLQNALNEGRVRYGGKPGTDDGMTSAMEGAFVDNAVNADPLKNFQGGQAAAHGAAQGASEAVADAFNPTWMAVLELQMSNLLNVANEASGTPSSAFAITKTHSQAIWFVQRMYSEVYIPMALLLLLPGAVLTQMKGVVSFGILSSSNDEDAVSPFVGILRAVIAIFLIPACQLIVSYSIDVGNALTQEVRQHVNILTIYNWANEQVFRAPLENARNQIMDPSMFPVLGKLSQGPEAQSGLEAQSTATVMLQTLANSMAESAAMGLVMLCAFQITMICYLMLLGPVAAAFYAWPAGLGNLFNRVFVTWVDAIINLSLWRFWWSVVLLCIDTRLGWLGALGGYSLFSEWELLMFIAFLTILTYVPFNPFDFKAGEMVSQLMQKAEQAVSESSKK